MPDGHATPDRVEIVDDMICDLITALSLKRNQDWHKTRAWIEGYTAAIVRYCDESRWQEQTTTTAGIVTLEMEATRS